MPTLEELRPGIQADAQILPKDLEAIETSSRDLFNTLVQEIQRIRTKANTVATLTQSLDGVETLPTMFSGILHNYRFGMDRSKKPMHRFEVEVPGTGLWLVSQFTSTELDALITTAPEMDIFDGEAIEGMMVTIKRDAKLGRMVPITFGQTNVLLGPVLLKDKKGVDVREGDIVSIRASAASFDRSITATVVSYDSGKDKLTVRQKSQKNDKTFKTKDLYRFERKGEPPIPYKAPLGVDMFGAPIFVGDLVRLYDEYENGKVAGILKSQADDDVLILTRTLTSSKGLDYRIFRTQVAKVLFLPVGFDGEGKPLFTGDRVKLGSEQALAYVVGQEGTGGPGSGVYLIRDDGKLSASSSDAGIFNANRQSVKKIEA